jgi:ERCC4-related helicase
MSYAKLIALAQEAGSQAGKVATGCKNVLRGLSEIDARALPKEVYKEFLNGRKTKALKPTDARTYNSLRQGFKRALDDMFKKVETETVDKTESFRIFAAFDVMINRLAKVESADLDVAKTLEALKDTRAKINGFVIGKK